MPNLSSPSLLPFRSSVYACIIMLVLPICSADMCIIIITCLCIVIIILCITDIYSYTCVCVCVALVVTVHVASVCLKM